jgi:16S rRNA (uracil1498-N3)-methyltransferase
LKQLILKNEPDKDNIIRLEGDDYRYMVRVRRLAAGNFFPALLPDGVETQIHILSVDSGILTGKCFPLSDAPNNLPQRRSLTPIILFQALPKGDKMDLIVRQAAESGITEIYPFVSEFSVAKINAGGQKFSRWERIIKEARQQSGSKTATAIHHPLEKNELFECWKKIKNDGENVLGLLFHKDTGSFNTEINAEGLEKKSLHEYLYNNPSVVVLAIGPEGGFSSEEVSIFLENGFMPMAIGDSVFRTETAALYCTAAVNILLLEKDSWELKKT